MKNSIQQGNKQTQRMLHMYRNDKIAGDNQAWVNCIDKARDYMREYMPQHEHVLAQMFELDSPRPRNKWKSATTTALQEEYNLSLSMIYKLNVKATEVVMIFALSDGLVKVD